MGVLLYKKGGYMKQALLILTIIALVPLFVSCAASKKVITGIGEGTGELAEGIATGAGEAVVGIAGLLKGTGEATAKVLGGGSGAQETAEEGFKAGGEGLKGGVGKTLEGVAGAIEEIGAGIK